MLAKVRRHYKKKKKKRRVAEFVAFIQHKNSLWFYPLHTMYSNTHPKFKAMDNQRRVDRRTEKDKANERKTSLIPLGRAPILSRTSLSFSLDRASP